MPTGSPRARAERERVLITGVGAVSPIGMTAQEYAASLRTGRSGVRPLAIESDRIASRVAADIPGFHAGREVGESEARRLPRLVPMALRAAREACAMARLAHIDAGASETLPAALAQRVGVILGTGGGGIDFTLDQFARDNRGQQPSLWTITNATHGNLAGELSIRLGYRGPSLCVSTGCASSSDAMGLALEMLRSPSPAMPDVFVVVGADAHIRWETLLTMELLGVLAVGEQNGAAHASRPFDRTRDGFVLGEGAWAIVLERESSARRREAGALLELAGYGATCDAHHRVRPAAEMEESARAMRLAIEDAGLAPRDVEATQCHGTSTRLNDALETRAIRLAFGAHADRLRCGSVKSMIGHPQGACGAAAVVAMACAMRGLDGGAPFLPPTINLREPDPECDLDYTPNDAADVAVRTALVNCLAFGAKNSALVLRAPE